MSRYTAIEIGQRFEEREAAIFGRQRRTLWRVTAVTPRADGLVHVTVVKEDDSTDMRTFSAPTLMDARRFRPATIENGSAPTGI
jgi:hypothetical protein